MSYKCLIRHSANCEGVFSLPVAWTGLFSVLLRDPRIPEKFPLGFLRASFLRSFLALFSKVLFWGFCGQHGLNMGPTWSPRGFQNREKSIKKGSYLVCYLWLNFYWFWEPLGWIFGGFWVPSWGPSWLKIAIYRKFGKQWIFDSRLGENTKIKVFRGSSSSKNRSQTD